MKITLIQLMVMYDILQDTCRFDVIVGGRTPEQRRLLVNEILEQQPSDLIDVTPGAVNAADKDCRVPA